MAFEASLEAYLAEQNRQGWFHGSVLVRRHGEILLDRGYGAADRQTGRPNTPETAFQIASVSKQFTAAAVLLLQERGVLSVQDHIHTWVPGCPTAWEPITVHHLLTHTSGLGHWADLPELSLVEPTTRKSLLRTFQRHPLKFPPGQGWAYSSPGYVLLAHIVEHLTGEPYARFLRQWVFEPLGMANTGAGNQAPHPERRALGYAGADQAPSDELETVIIGAGDLWATTRDLGRWGTALATPGLLRAESLQAMFTPHAAVPMAFVQDFFAELAKVSYGYGWFLGETEGHRLRLTPGDNAGFRSSSLQLADRDGLIVLLSNDAHSRLTQISHQLVTQMLADPGSPGSTHP